MNTLEDLSNLLTPHIGKVSEKFAVSLCGIISAVNASGSYKFGYSHDDGSYYPAHDNGSYNGVGIFTNDTELTLLEAAGLIKVGWAKDLARILKPTKKAFDLYDALKKNAG